MNWTSDSIDDVIKYHQPNEEGLRAISAIRVATAEMIKTIVANVPDCADRTAAIRKVREAMMTSNAAIVLKGAV